MDTKKKYGKAVFELVKQALHSRGVLNSWGAKPEFIHVENTGVFWKDPEALCTEKSSADRSVARDSVWRYVEELIDVSNADQQTLDIFTEYPSLPIPFTSGQLAGCMMGGRLGLLLTDLFGELGGPPCAEEVTQCFSSSPLFPLVRQALESAYAAHDEALAAVGGYRAELGDSPEYRTWRRRMVEFLCEEDRQLILSVSAEKTDEDVACRELKRKVVTFFSNRRSEKAYRSDWMKIFSKAWEASPIDLSSTWYSREFTYQHVLGIKEKQIAVNAAAKNKAFPSEESFKKWHRSELRCLLEAVPELAEEMPNLKRFLQSVRSTAV